MKSDPDNITIERNPEKSTIAKYLELKRLREEIQQMKRDFNGQVIAARQQKLDLCDYVKVQLKKLDGIQREIPADQAKSIATIPSIDENVELLDRKFDMAASIVAGETPISNRSASISENNVKSDFYQAILQMDAVASSSKHNATETDLRQLRRQWKLFEQNVIIEEVNARISKFDEHLLALKNRRLEIALEVNFMELYYFTVYQELMVLRNFEKSQTLLMQDIEAGRCERGRIEAKMMGEKQVLHELQQHANDLQESADDIERQFIECHGDGEFASISELVFRGEGTYNRLEHHPMVIRRGKPASFSRCRPDPNTKCNRVQFFGTAIAIDGQTNDKNGRQSVFDLNIFIWNLWLQFTWMMSLRR